MENKIKILDIGDHIQLSIAECHPTFVERSAALFAVDDKDRPDLFATCVALSLNGRSFLVTAAHAISEITSSGSAVHIGGKEIKVVPGSFTQSSPDGHDPLDVAFVEVPRDFVVSNGMTLVSEGQLVLEREIENPHLHCMHGFPLTKNKPFKSVNTARKHVTTYAFTYAGALKTNPDFHDSERSSDSHIALSYQLSKNDQGVKVNPPSPKGMSGGGLWVVPDSFKPKVNFYGGVLVEHHGKTVLATKTHKLIEFIGTST